MATNKGIPPALAKRLLAVAAAGVVATGGLYQAGEQGRVDAQAVQLARAVGLYYESSGKHIGAPYVDRAGKGQPWTVCGGVTGPDVVPGRYYTTDDCDRLETAAYGKALAVAKRALKNWPGYNAYVRASFIDVAYNVPSALTTPTTLLALANAGDLTGACMQMPRWVYGTVRGQKQQLPGLVDRRASTRELCAEWGRAGHFSAVSLPAPLPTRPAALPLPAEPAPELAAPAPTALPWWRRPVQSIFEKRS